MKNFFIMLFMVSFGLKSIKIQAQCNANLVPNPSFEDYSQCPTTDGQLGLATGWIKFKSNPDYQNACDISNIVGVPRNMWGYQPAASGQAYAGMISFSFSGNQTTSFREYIGIQLISPLIPGTKYYVSLKVSPTIANSPVIGSNKYVNNKMGVLFTVSSSANLPIPNFAHVYTDSIVSDTSAWSSITSSFVADTNYKYVVVGNFFDDNLTSYTALNPSGMWDMSYYYIDDVCVSTDSSECVSSVFVCYDGDLCTTDTCINGQCTHLPIDCNDNNACTVDSCDSGECVHATIDCDDNNICTIDACDSIIGCIYGSINCDDYFICTKDACDSLTGCIYSTLNCNDLDSCTIDFCDSLSGCNYLPDTNCTNGITSYPSEILTIYPNPTSGLLTIESSVPILSVRIRIYNVLGQLSAAISNEQMNLPITLHLSILPDGFYMMNIETENSFFNHKILLTH